MRPLRVQVVREQIGELQLVPAEGLGLCRRPLGRHQLAVGLVLHETVHEVVACEDMSSLYTVFI